ncbi:MAG: hypothetical protein HC897_16635 [Thermoanaerobaculia bacterium]|nr:hypothetical protein [Thermoanaerobaculia bacterium]
MGALLQEAAELARRLVIEQGRWVLEQWPEVGALEYKDARDMRTRIDVAVEEALIEALSRRFPDHGFCGEETGEHNPDADYRWLIDPIDGTKYFVGHASLFSISLALLERGEPVVGVVYNVPAGQCFHACRGGGAFLDERRLTGPVQRPLAEAVINVDTPASDRLPEAERVWFESRLVALTRHVYRIRALGQGSLAACWLASGAFDAYLDLTGHTGAEDVTAGVVIMNEAGLEVDRVEVGVGPRRLLAAPPALFALLRAVLMNLHD